MPLYYLTFGQGSPLRNGWVNVWADSKLQASEYAVDAFGSKWSMLYEHGVNDFDPYMFPEGCKGTIGVPEREPPVTAKPEFFRMFPRIPKVWGNEFVLVNRPQYCSKVLEIRPGYRCSLHHHIIKDETFIVMRGDPVILIHGVLGQTGVGDIFHVSPGTQHCFGVSHARTESALILEVSTSHSDEDVVRASQSGEFSWSLT